MKIYESGEDYLETILILKRKKGNVRSVDITEELNYSKSSVSRAVNILKDKGFITIDNNGLINFTKEGLGYANYIYERHNVISGFLTEIGVPKEIADSDACKIEHDLSKESYNAIKRLLKNKSK